MAFPPFPTNNNLHASGSKLWRYNNGIWRRDRKAGIITYTTSARGINEAGGYWQQTGNILNKPIPPNRKFLVLVNMYASYLDDIDLDGEYAKFTMTAYNGSTRLSTIYRILYVTNTYPVSRYRHGMSFAFNWKVSQNFVTRMDFRCDWFIRQVQSGPWIQWNWDWSIISD